jgi:hypothetical protein
VNPHNTRRDVNPGIYHEEFACEDYLNFEEKKEIYCKKRAGRPLDIFDMLRPQSASTINLLPG